MYSQTVGGYIILNHQGFYPSLIIRLVEHALYKFGTAHKTEFKGTLFNQDIRKFTFQIFVIQKPTHESNREANAISPFSLIYTRYLTSNTQPNGSETYSMFYKHYLCKRMYLHISLKYYAPETNGLCSAKKYLH